nr:hypothetical protein [Tanacetum cinerariifolium]
IVALILAITTDGNEHHPAFILNARRMKNVHRNPGVYKRHRRRATKYWLVHLASASVS